jgi:hypothetical protein
MEDKIQQIVHLPIGRQHLFECICYSTHGIFPHPRSHDGWYSVYYALGMIKDEEKLEELIKYRDRERVRGYVD